MRLAEIMEQTHTRQSDLADYLGMSRAAVSQYISGKREPDIATLTKIAKFFNVSLDYLAGRVDDETPQSRVPKNYIEIGDREIRLYPGDFVRVHIGNSTFDFTVEEIEL